MKPTAVFLALAFLVGCPADKAVKPLTVASASLSPIGYVNPSKAVKGVPREAITASSLAGWEVLSDDRTFRVYFVGGREPCGQLDHVEIEYTPHEVRLLVWLGIEKTAYRRAQDEEKKTGIATGCDDVGISAVTVVRLKERVNQRTIVDVFRDRTAIYEAMKLVELPSEHLMSLRLQTYLGLRTYLGKSAPASLESREDRWAWYVAITGARDRTRHRPIAWFVLAPRTYEVLARGTGDPALNLRR